MRLLHLETLKLKEFFNEDVPPYAILSHRWGPNEVSFKEMRKSNLDDHPGMLKIQNFCAFARTWKPRGEAQITAPDHARSTEWDRLKPVEWGWLDTCCIDKSSSAELSEAINSMFSWYRDSQYCCVYLADVTSSSSGTWQEFQRSEWFSRGWTLQELLSPATVLFCDSRWRIMGHKCSHALRSHALQYCLDGREGMSLNGEIARATNIGRNYLKDPLAYKNASIATRMSWASKRNTTRVEDIAYCLLGIFSVHLPPLYGEGLNAFRRLQEEIIRHSNDQSIFAWFTLDRYLRTYTVETWVLFATPILAFHPAEFASSFGVSPSGQAPDSPYVVTNNGLELRANVHQYETALSGKVVLTLDLNCTGGARLPTNLHKKGERTLNTRIAIVKIGSGKNDLMRVHFRPTSYFTMERLLSRGENETVLYVKTEGAPHRFTIVEDRLDQSICKVSGDKDPIYRSPPVSTRGWDKIADRDLSREKGQSGDRRKLYHIPNDE